MLQAELKETKRILTYNVIGDGIHMLPLPPSAKVIRYTTSGSNLFIHQTYWNCYSVKANRRLQNK